VKTYFVRIMGEIDKLFVGRNREGRDVQVRKRRVGNDRGASHQRHVEHRQTVEFVTVNDLVIWNWNKINSFFNFDVKLLLYSKTRLQRTLSYNEHSVITTIWPNEYLVFKKSVIANT